MSDPRVTVVVPTLTAGQKLSDCLHSLDSQTMGEMEIVVVDNSGCGLARQADTAGSDAIFIENERNVGFGAAVNQGIERGKGRYVATLNDDAVAEPQWLAALVEAIETAPDVGLCASRVMRSGADRLDSAGMLLAADGTSKQRGQGRPASEFAAPADVLFPSGSAALYSREMLDQIGGFDDTFFLYCEDTDLGLRACWAGWRCLYVPDAIVQHHYSGSAGRASPLKAYLVERNRLFVIAKNFPLAMLLRVPFSAIARYFWHVSSILKGRGAAAEFRQDGGNPLRLVWYVIRAHFALLAAFPRLWRERRAVRRTAKLSAREFQKLTRAHAISAREVGAL